MTGTATKTCSPICGEGTEAAVVAPFVLAAKGRTMGVGVSQCPAGTEAVTQGDCEAASVSAGAAFNFGQAGINNYVESWADAPPGCFIRAFSAWYVQWNGNEREKLSVHFNTGVGTDRVVDPQYQNVCRSVGPAGCQCSAGFTGMTGTTTKTCQTQAETQAALATTAKAAAFAADAHLANNNYASSETFYLRSYELFTQELDPSHFMAKAMLARVNKVREVQGKAPATDADASGVSTPLDPSTVPNQRYDTSTDPVTAPATLTLAAGW
jgi:hypothetical protein